MLDRDTKVFLLSAQKNEITEYNIYRRLSEIEKDPANKKVLRQISDDELRHYSFWKRFTGEDAGPDRLKAFLYVLAARMLGITFAIKLMENGEKGAQVNYSRISKKIPGAKKIAGEEDRHEDELIGMISEERLKYVGSMVLGMNDAIVELTGALAGFSFALQNTSLIAATGFITGVAAALSMAASEYLSTKSEKSEKSPMKASVYTGIIYFVTVLLLILPYVIFRNLYVCLAATIAMAIVIIFVFSYYISVIQEFSFRRRFFEVTAVSLGIAALTFVIGYVIKVYAGISI